MAVGPKSQSPETLAAMAAQARPDPNAQTPDQVAAAEAAAKAVATKAAEEEAAKAAAATGTETPSSKETEKSAESDNKTDVNMQNVKVQSQEEIDKALADAGFSNDALGKELADNKGKLTEATVTALKEKFNPEAVDNAVKDMESQFTTEAGNIDAKTADANKSIDTMNDFIYGSLAGGDIEKGKTNLATLSTWAKDNMGKEDLASVNALLRSGDKVAVKRGLEMAVSQWKKGQEKPMMEGSAAAAAATDEVKLAPLSKDEFIQLTMSEKYEKDPVYAKEIDDRRRATMKTEGMITPEFSHLRPPI